MSAELAITGTTGRLGGRVARLLSGAGLPLRLLVRDPGRAPRIPGAALARCDYADRPAAQAALAGCEVLFMVSAAEAPDRLQQHQTFIDAAAAAGVRHVVYTSFFGAAADATFTLAQDHWNTEEHLRASGLEFTVLRDNFYQNVFPQFVGADGVLRGPAGTGRVSAVARQDVAGAAAAVLRQPQAHRGAVYQLTGPEAFTLAEAARIITAQTGREVSYRDETLAEAYASRAVYGAPDWQVEAWVSTYTAIASGALAEVTDDVRRLTGTAPLSFAQFMAAAARKPGAA